MLFQTWSGAHGIEAYITKKTGCKPFSGAGINPRIAQKTTLLRSVDDTYYYADDLNDLENIQYTLFGHVGDQSEEESRFNEPLLNQDKTKHIYVYRVKPKGKRNEYIWYGKYEIVGKITKPHIGKDKQMRNIIVLCLHRIEG